MLTAATGVNIKRVTINSSSQNTITYSENSKERVARRHVAVRGLDTGRVYRMLSSGDGSNGRVRSISALDNLCLSITNVGMVERKRRKHSQGAALVATGLCVAVHCCFGSVAVTYSLEKYRV